MSVPLVDVVATEDGHSRRRFLSVINRDPVRPAALRIREDARPLTAPVALRVVGGRHVDPWAANTGEHPRAVVPWDAPPTTPDKGVIEVPPRWLAVLEWRVVRSPALGSQAAEWATPKSATPGPGSEWCSHEVLASQPPHRKDSD